MPLTPWVDRDHRRPDRQLVAAQLVVVFGVIGRIRDETVPLRVSGGLANGGWELGRILGRPPTDYAPSDQMGVGIDHPRQCRPASAGKAPVASAPDVVATGMTGFQARGINDPSRSSRQQPKGLHPLPQVARSGIEVGPPHQTLRRVTQGRIVRHPRSTQYAAEPREVPKGRAEAAVVSLETWPQHQAGEAWRWRIPPG